MTLCHRIIHQSFRLTTKPMMIRIPRFHDRTPHHPILQLQHLCNFSQIQLNIWLNQYALLIIQRETLLISLQEFAIEAENLGLPLIPQEIIEGFFERIRPHDASPEIIARDAFAIAVTRLTLVPIITRTREEQIIVHPVGAPPTFTVQADANIINNSDSDSPDPESELPMNLFPQEFNSSN